MQRFAELLDRLVLTPSRNGKLTLLVDYFRDRRGSRPRAGAGGHHRRSRRSPRQAGDAARAGRRAHGPGAVRLFLRLCRRSRRDRVAGLAGAAEHGCGQPRADARRGRREAAVGEPLRRAARAGAACSTAPASTARYALIKLVTGGLRIGVSARLAKQALADLGKVDVAEIEELWHGLTPPYAELFAWLEGKAPTSREKTAQALFRPVMLSKPVEDGDLEKLDPADYAAEWKWDGIRVQAVSEGGMRRLYSRTGDDISGAFPDLVEAMDFDAALDGELLVGDPPEATGTFSDLQQRLNRKTRVAEDRASNIRPSCAATISCSTATRICAPCPSPSGARVSKRFVATLDPTRFDLSPLVAFADWAGARRDAQEPAASGHRGRDAEAAAIRPISPAGRRARGSSGSAIRTRSTRC